MEWRRIKTIIIAILVLINGFLLVLVGARRGEVRRYEQSALTRTVAVLAENGITLSPDDVTLTTPPTPRAAERSTAAEAAVARALLGEGVQEVNGGGGLYLYRGSLGEVSWRAGGAFTAQLADDPRFRTGDPVTHANALLDQMGVDAQLMDMDLEGESGALTYRQTVGGAPVFSCLLTLRYEQGRLTRLDGTVLALEDARTEEGTGQDLPTALMHFLDQVITGGDVCSAILSVEPGYRTAQSFSSVVRLTPVWHISTNTADYYVDAATGEATRVE